MLVTFLSTVPDSFLGSRPEKKIEVRNGKVICRAIYCSDVDCDIHTVHGYVHSYIHSLPLPPPPPPPLTTDAEFMRFLGIIL
jgi:hypothetical protein